MLLQDPLESKVEVLIVLGGGVHGQGAPHRGQQPAAACWCWCWCWWSLLCRLAVVGGAGYIIVEEVVASSRLKLVKVIKGAGGCPA